MDQREILTRFKAGTLDRGSAAQLLNGLAPAHPSPPSAPPAPRVPAPPVPGPSAPVSPPGAASGTAPGDASGDALGGGSPGGSSGGIADGLIAVIGMAGRYPYAPDLPAYWRNLCDGRDTSSAAPPDERPGGSPLEAGQRGHFLDQVAEFDPEFFGLSAAEGRLMDPQERLFLETAWTALEDAGCTGARLDALTAPGDAPRGIGVYVGVSAADYALLAAGQWSRGRDMPRSGHGTLPARLSGLLGLCGPGRAVDAGGSSGLVAVQLAADALSRGECAAALAGGVELLLHPSRARQSAGEGVGAVVLKPLGRALADGDQVYAVIRAGAEADPPGRPEPTGLHETWESTVRRVGDAGAATGIAAVTAAVLQLGHATLAPVREGDTARTWPGPPDVLGGTRPRRAEVRVPDACGLETRLVLEEFVPPHRDRDRDRDRADGVGRGGEAGEAGEVGRGSLESADGDHVVRADGDHVVRPHGDHVVRADGDHVVRADGDHVVRADGDDVVRPGGGHVLRPDGDGAAREELVLLSAPTPEHLAATAARLAEWLTGVPGGVPDGVPDEAPPELAATARALRAGRAALPCRLAVLARDTGQLAGLLGEFAASGAAARDGVSVRCVDLRTGTADPLALGEVPETRAYLAALWRAGRTEQLTRMWLSGVAVDWAALGDGPQGKRTVPLPPSAFLRRRLWLGEPSGEGAGPDGTEAVRAVRAEWAERAERSG